MQAEQFTEIAEKQIDTVYRVALNCLGSPDSADDVTQEVFLRLLRSKKAFESDEHLRAWLIRVTINECKRFLSSRWRKMEPLETYENTLLFSLVENNEVFDAVMRLPRNYRMVIHLHYYEGYSTAEIARMLKSKRSTVCTQLERGRKLLKKMFLEAEDV
ncbi:MAG: sigma-70 family RNA polymerase sigma factor [Oscillospiraceae bacterium]|nr:sigma-70 family RNA polymerase sigma factor [Oscillospiraceae bacterium]